MQVCHFSKYKLRCAQGKKGQKKYKKKSLCKRFRKSKKPRCRMTKAGRALAAKRRASRRRSKSKSKHRRRSKSKSKSRRRRSKSKSRSRRSKSRSKSRRSKRRRHSKKRSRKRRFSKRRADSLDAALEALEMSYRNQDELEYI